MQARQFVRGVSAGGFHRIAVSDHGPGDVEAKAVVCVHGLTRNGRDFDVLADHLSTSRRVICPDIVGRGASDWLADPSGYAYPQYISDMACVLAWSGEREVDWIGTSMGGLIGLLIAAMPRSPIRRLILNDVGPFIPGAALNRIAEYVGKDPSFPSLTALEAYLRDIHAPFGPLSDGQWRDLATHSMRRKSDGALGLAYDPAIANGFAATPMEDIDLWSVYERVTCPVHVLRGEKSDLLTAATAASMAEGGSNGRGPKALVTEIAGCGHAPALMSQAEMDIVDLWLDMAIAEPR